MWTTEWYHKCSTKHYQWITISHWKQGNQKTIWTMLFSNCWREKSNRLKGQMLDYMQLKWQSSRHHVSRGQSSHKPCIKRTKFTQAMYQEGKVHTNHASRGQSSHKPCIKRAKFTQTMHQEGKVHTSHASRGQSSHKPCIKMENLTTSWQYVTVAEIINICYDNYTRRTPKQILRLYNLCYLFSSTCISVIGNPNTMSDGKLFGNHFQSDHTCSRVLQTRSVVP